jgi:hypothetical protein
MRPSVIGRPRRPARAALSGEPPTPTQIGSSSCTRAGRDGSIVQRRPEAAGPRDVVVGAQRQQQVELLGEEGVVVLQPLAEEREGLGERAAPDGELRTTVADEVELGEVLVDPDGVEDSSLAARRPPYLDATCASGGSAGLLRSREAVASVPTNRSRSARRIGLGRSGPSARRSLARCALEFAESGSIRCAQSL